MPRGRQAETRRRTRLHAANESSEAEKGATTMSKRRGHGEGSIYKRADGRWAGALNLGWQNGRRRRRLVYGKTRREVAERLTKLRYDHQRGLPVLDDRRPLGDFLSSWLDNAVRPSVRPRT